MKQVTVRCSSLPLLQRCAASLNDLPHGSAAVLTTSAERSARGGTATPAAPNPEATATGSKVQSSAEGVRGNRVLRIDPFNDAANLGTGAHAAIEEFIRTGEDPDLTKIRRLCDIDDDNADDLEMLFSKAKALWLNHIKAMMPDPMLEVPLSVRWSDGETLYVLTGHIDICSLPAPNHAVLVDWKSGYVKRDYGAQTTGYAYLASKRMLVQKVTTITVFLRDGTYSCDTFTDDELASWFNRVVVDQISKNIGRYSPGEHCEHCPAFAGCAGRGAMVRQAVDDLVAGSGKRLAEILDDPEQRAALGPELSAVWDRRGMVKSAIDALEKAVRSSVERHGPIPFGDGRSLAITESERKSIDAQKGWPLLTEAIPDESKLAACLKVVKGEVEECVKADAPRGQKKGVVADLMASLETAGAMTTTITKTLRVVEDEAAKEPANAA